MCTSWSSVTSFKYLCASGVEPTGATWQLWTDQLIYMVAMALPWAGAELGEGAPTELGKLMEAIDAYIVSANVYIVSAHID